MGRATTMKIALIPFLLWTVAPLPSTAGEEETWVLVESPHFAVATNAGENWAQVVATEFEKIRAVFLNALVGAENDPYQPIIIWAVKEERSFHELLPEYAETEGPGPSGVFLQGADKHFMVLRLDTSRGLRAELMYHEYYHLLMAVNFGAAPIWVEEGMAELWGNTVIRGNKVEMGLPDRSHLEYLKRKRLIPLAEFFAVQSNPHQSDPSRVTLFYAQSWALMHYIMLGEESKRLLPAVDVYLKLVEEGTDPGVAGFQAFGDLAQLEESLRGYLRSRLQVYKMEMPVEVDDKVFPVRTLTFAESLALRGNFLAHGSSPINALPLLEEALRLDPTSTIAYEGMGYLRFRQNQPDEAARWFEKAVELDTESFLAHYYMAMLPEETDGSGGTPRTERALRKSILLNPRFAPAYRALANHYIRRQQNRDEALEFALMARELEPANPSNWLTVGAALLTLERLDEAHENGTRSLSISKTSEARTAAVRFLQRVEEHAHYLAARFQSVLGMAEIEGTTGPLRDANDDLNLKGLADRLRWVRENTAEVTGRFSTLECGTGQGFDAVIITKESKYVLGSPGGQSLRVTERGRDVQKSFPCGPQGGEVTAKYIMTGDTEATTDVRGKLLSLEFK